MFIPTINARHATARFCFRLPGAMIDHTIKPMPGYSHWRAATEAHITTLTLNRPDAKNSLTPETLSELRAITTDLRASQENAN